MVNNVKKRIDDYLEFDSDFLFKIPDTLIFGGAIRDSIAGDRINDVDILINPIYFDAISNFLLQNGYIFNDSLTKKLIQSIYKEIKIISEPKTFFNKNGKIVQLIKPRLQIFSNNNRYIKTFSDLIANVDISSCALSYNGNVITEHYEDAYYHARYKIFYRNVNAIMYSFERFEQRKRKLSDRGWVEIKNNNEDILIRIDRERSIDNVLGLVNYNKDYIINKQSGKIRV